MMSTEFAIVDIETTGGSASNSRITEIAIIIHNGTTEISRWESLINPGREIPPYIQALTGITDAMVERAPTFESVANTIYDLLHNRIFVAHNVNFDFSFVRHELKLAGFEWAASKLCTVRAARKVRPGLPSYSLGKLCQSLDIRLENRHRAGGDASATAILLAQLIAWDDLGEIAKMLKKTAPDQRLPPNLPPDDFNKLPQKPGVYYFYNQDKKVIYVGKAVNIKKRVASHFTGNTVKSQRQHFLREIYSISYEECATELMALLLECTEIRKLWPAYNTALKRFEPRFGLYEYEARNGYRYLAVGKVSKQQPCVEVFSDIASGIDVLRRLGETYEIDHRFCIYGVGGEQEFIRGRDTSNLPDKDAHNDRVEEAVATYLNARPSFAILDKGRTFDEKSCIWVEKGHFYGMGYLSSDVTITDTIELKDYVTPYKGNAYMMTLIHSFAEKYPKKIVLIENQ